MTNANCIDTYPQLIFSKQTTDTFPNAVMETHPRTPDKIPRIKTQSREKTKNPNPVDSGAITSVRGSPGDTEYKCRFYRCRDGSAPDTNAETAVIVRDLFGIHRLDCWGGRQPVARQQFQPNRLAWSRGTPPTVSLSVQWSVSLADRRHAYYSRNHFYFPIYVCDCLVGSHSMPECRNVRSESAAPAALADGLPGLARPHSPPAGSGDFTTRWMLMYRVVLWKLRRFCGSYCVDTVLNNVPI